MTQGKQRVTVTVDPELVDAGNRAVASGAAGSLSAWVNAALAERAQRDEQRARMGDAIADYEAEFGEITADEIATQRRVDREQATVVRGTRPPKRARAAKSA
jgi:Arc/MetJ-type ribon-helix-helix transcriptional regulator